MLNIDSAETRTLLILLIWLALALTALVMLERLTHFRIHRIGLRLLGSDERAILFHAAIFLPGVALHEAAHAAMAMMLGVPTGGISLIPERKPDGSLRLGYAEVGQADPLRGSLVGVAPLLAGAAALLWLLSGRVDVSVLTQAAQTLRWPAWGRLFQDLQAPAWLVILGLYLCFAVANSMIPSPSDRRDWLVAGILLALLVAALLFTGILGSVVSVIRPYLVSGAAALATGFTVAALINAACWPLLYLGEMMATEWAFRQQKRRPPARPAPARAPVSAEAEEESATPRRPAPRGGRGGKGKR